MIIDTTGAYIYVPGIGSSDEVAYNSGDNHWYTGSQNTPYSPHPVASDHGRSFDHGRGRRHARGDRRHQPDPRPDRADHGRAGGDRNRTVSGSSHSVAVNSANNWVFVPMPANNTIPGCLTGCIAVYGRQDVDKTGASD